VETPSALSSFIKVPARDMKVNKRRLNKRVVRFPHVIKLPT
jgi:hypothetical protein